MSLTMTKTGDAVSIYMNNASLELQAEEGFFTLRMHNGGDQVEIALSPKAMQTLGLLCVAHLPALESQYTVTDSEDPYREPARFIKEMGDSELQLAIREWPSDTLIDFLWYMKDAELIRKVFKNMTKRAAGTLMEELDSRWHGKNPDALHIADARTGRTAVTDILYIVQRLVDEGQIADYFGGAE